MSPLRRSCRVWGCREPVPGVGPRLCARHTREGQAHADRVRGTAAARGYTAAWARESKAFLAAHPWCARCAQRGARVPATVTDHIVPHKGDPRRFWNRSNWQPLCGRCNRAKGVESEGGFGRVRGCQKFDSRGPKPGG